MSQNAANIDRIYVVRSGDSLSKIAQSFYGDATLYPVIATANKVNPQGILMIGQTLHIPPKPGTTSSTVDVQEVQITAQRLPEQTMPQSPGGSVPQEYNGGTIETVIASARVWYKDWRWWAAIGVVGVGVWYFTRNSRNRSK